MLNSVRLIAYTFIAVHYTLLLSGLRSLGEKGMAPAAPELSFFTSIHFNLFRQNIKPLKLKKKT